MKYTQREKKLIQLIKQKKLSQSHHFDHLKRVANFALLLADKYEGDKEVVTAAALLHDLGRTNRKTRGKQTAIEGARLSKKLLEKAKYSSGQVKLIIRVIAEHDQPDFHSEILESRILKDADFIDGFGARGVMRSVLYAGETSEGVDEAVDRLRVRGRQRLDGLEFVESKRMAWKLYRFTDLFLSEFEKELSLGDVFYSGKLIVLEGISGCGKDTQAKMLKQYFEREGKKAVIVNHPTDFMKKLWRLWRKEVDDRSSELFLMLADRARMVNKKIIPALKKGKMVISSRSSVSSQIYQAVDDETAAFARFCFSFEPVADILFYLKVSPSVALKRVDARVKHKKEKDRGFFGSKQKQQQKRLEEVLLQYPNVIEINASGDKQKVHKHLVGWVERLEKL